MAGKVFESGLGIGFVNGTPLDKAEKSEFSLISIDFSVTVLVDGVEDILRLSILRILLRRRGTAFGGIILSKLLLGLAIARLLAVARARARAGSLHGGLGLCLGDLLVITGNFFKLGDRAKGFFLSHQSPVDSALKSISGLLLINFSAAVLVNEVEDKLWVFSSSCHLLIGRLGRAFGTIIFLWLSTFLFKELGGKGSDCEKSGGVDFHRFFELCVFLLY